MRICYLYSRFPVISHTFCVREMLGIEKINESNLSLEIVSLNPPTSGFSHDLIGELDGLISYPPEKKIFSKIRGEIYKNNKVKVDKLVDEFETKFGREINFKTRILNALYFGRIFQDRGVDHIHVHFTNQATITAFFIKYFYNINFSFTAHGKDYLSGLHMSMVKFLSYESKFIICVSEYSKKHFQSYFPNCSDKIYRVYNGVDTFSKDVIEDNKSITKTDQVDISSINLKRGEPKDIVKILYVGRLVEFKGVDILLKALVKIKRLNLTNIKFICQLVGEGEEKESLEKIDAENDLDVIFEGSRSLDEIYSMMDNSDIFVIASKVDVDGSYDMLPTVISEAMSMGLPIISTKIAGIPEMVKNNFNGYLVDYNNVSSLAYALANLINNKNRRKEFSRNSFEMVREKFDEKVTISHLNKIFHENIHLKNGLENDNGSDEIRQFTNLVIIRGDDNNKILDFINRVVKKHNIFVLSSDFLKDQRQINYYPEDKALQIYLNLSKREYKDKKNAHEYLLRINYVCYLVNKLNIKNIFITDAFYFKDADNLKNLKELFCEEKFNYFYDSSGYLLLQKEKISTKSTLLKKIGKIKFLDDYKVLKALKNLYS